MPSRIRRPRNDISMERRRYIRPPRPSARGFVAAPLTRAGTANTKTARYRTSQTDVSIAAGYVRRNPPNNENARIGSTILRGAGAQNSRPAIRVVSSCATWALFAGAVSLIVPSPPRRCPGGGGVFRLFHDGPRDEDVSARACQRRGRGGGPDPAANDQGDLNRALHRTDHRGRGGVRGSAPPPEGHQAHPPGLGPEGPPHPVLPPPSPDPGRPPDPPR